FAVLDIGPRGIPANGVSRFVSQRVVVNQEPAILTIPAADSSFVLEWNPSRERRIAFVAQSLGILRMKDAHTKVFRHNFFSRQAGVLLYCLIRVQIFPSVLIVMMDGGRPRCIRRTSRSF